MAKTYHKTAENQEQASPSRMDLAGLIEALERYSASVDRAYYLEEFDSGGFTLDRMASQVSERAA